MNVVVFSKEGCPYCEVLIDWLNNADIDYEIVYAPERSNGAYPRVLYKNKTVFIGLPSAKDLNNFIQEIK